MQSKKADGKTTGPGLKQLLGVMSNVQPQLEQDEDIMEQVTDERVGYMEALHFLAKKHIALESMPDFLRFMRERGGPITEEHNDRHQIRKALGVLWGVLSDAVRSPSQCHPK